MQPVLQWGRNCEGIFCLSSWGGNYWTIANWIVGGNFGTAWSQDIRVNPGDVLWGAITMESSTSYQIAWDDTTLGQWGWLNVNLTGSNSTVQFNTAQPSVLEAYNVSNCSDYPAQPTWFYDILMNQAGPEWNSWNPVAEDPATWGGGVTPGLAVSCNYIVANWYDNTNGGGEQSILSYLPL